MKEIKQLSVLENLESAKQYRRWLISLASELFKNEVFELGSGIGLYARDFLSWNVLEHINDDVAALKLANKVCIPGSSVFALVPAMPFAYSKFDRELHHFRRYTKTELLSKAKLAGLKEVEVHYVNGIGILNWYVFVKVLNLRPKNNLLLKIYDQVVVPVQVKIERKIGLPFGQSLVLRAKTT